MTKKKRTSSKPTVVGELIERLTEIDRRFSAGTLNAARQKVLSAEETFVVSQIAAAIPETLADCVPMLMIAADKATTMQAMAEDRRQKSPEMTERDSAHAAELSAVVARVLKFLAAKADVDLDKIGARIWLDQNEHFPEYDSSVAAKAA